MSLQSISFGDKAQVPSVEKYKGVDGTKDVIGIISKKNGVFSAVTHYIDNIRMFYCFEGSCCQHNTAALRYIVPIVQYTIESTATWKRILPVEVKYLSLGYKAYENLLTMDSIAPGGLDHVDLLVSCEDSKFQRLSFNVLPGESTWRTNPEIFAQVKEGFERYKALIEKSVAMPMDDAGLQQAMARALQLPAPNHGQQQSSAQSNAAAFPPSPPQQVISAPAEDVNLSDLLRPDNGSEL